MGQSEEKQNRVIWQTTKGQDELHQHRDRWLWLVWHPGAFDGVSTTELLALNQIYEPLQRQQCDVIALSRDSVRTLMAWAHQIYDSTGIEILFPLAQDQADENSVRFFDFEHLKQSHRLAVLIGPDGEVWARLEYPDCVGHHTGELLRILQAIQVAQREGMKIPANWQEGTALVLPEPQNYEELLKRTMMREGLCCMDWYLCFTDQGKGWEQRKKENV